jgi:hypothetical protein
MDGREMDLLQFFFSIDARERISHNKTDAMHDESRERRNKKRSKIISRSSESEVGVGTSATTSYN